MIAPFQIKRGDLEPPFKVEIIGVDLTGCTVQFVMSNTLTPKVNHAATITDAPNGIVSYSWIAGDTDTVGSYKAEWVITYPNGHKRTVPSGGYDYVDIVASLT
jgi:hypothetical protein